MGLTLTAGRNFTSGEIRDHNDDDLTPPAAVIITRHLAEKLFPGKSALGESVYLEFQKARAPVVGIVERLTIPWTNDSAFTRAFTDNAILEALRFTSSFPTYVVRAKPGQLAVVRQAAQKALFDINRGRVIEKVRSMSEVRRDAYRDDKGLAVMLAIVCATLLAITAFGIVGLTSYWVTQRRRQIGIRRALGATRTAIVRYFQTENLLISIVGAVAGVALALSINLWMVRSFEMARLDVAYLVGGSIAVLVLGQLAVWYPASRAASIPPALATRAA
jgi:putative ABC transport system permease protein